MTKETEIRYEWKLGKSPPIAPYNQHIIYEEEPLSDKHIEALAHLMRANREINPMNWTMLIMGILYIGLIIYLSLN